MPSTTLQGPLDGCRRATVLRTASPRKKPLEVSAVLGNSTTNLLAGRAVSQVSCGRPACLPGQRPVPGCAASPASPVVQCDAGNSPGGRQGQQDSSSTRWQSGQSRSVSQGACVGPARVLPGCPLLIPALQQCQTQPQLHYITSVVPSWHDST